ncbi:MAG TPA: hypothetical protein VGQ37_26330 [Vicinamibacterales bacterium]|jgi:hypothetical protein|nr:hypothetical protein [Vicinamibacterales bacterium]
MVLLLTDALAVPLWERNAFLLAAGFAPMFRESALANEGGTHGPVGAYVVTGGRLRTHPERKIWWKPFSGWRSP